MPYGSHLSTHMTRAHALDVGLRGDRFAGMAKVPDLLALQCDEHYFSHDEFAVPEGSTLAGAARTDDPPAVPMSGGAEPAGAAKHHE